MTTSYRLSTELWELGLKIETEKWWCPSLHNEHDEVFLIFNEEKVSYEDDDAMLPAYSTDELLEILPAMIMGDNKCSAFLFIIKSKEDYVVAYDYNADCSWSEQRDKFLPEALGLMCKHLLTNGYVYKDGMIRKGC